MNDKQGSRQRGTSAFGRDDLPENSSRSAEGARHGVEDQSAVHRVPLPPPIGPLFQSQRRELQLLARELFQKRSGLLAAWSDACVVFDSETEATVGAAVEPLLTALSAGRAEVAETVLAELAAGLRMQGVGRDGARSAMYGLLGSMRYVSPSTKWSGALVGLGALLLEAVQAAYPLGESAVEAAAALDARVRRAEEAAPAVTEPSAKHESAARRPGVPEAAKSGPVTGPTLRAETENSAEPAADELQARMLTVGLVGRSPAMQEVWRQLCAVANAPGSVLIIGESGTGKELIAQAIHGLGPQRRFAMVSVNCAALPNELIESELFGHERGAFTGGAGSRGLMRAAGRGLLFLDEITEMPIATQPKLLRALDQRTVRPVGSVREQAFEARVVAATNREPVTAIRDGMLRADLFYRLAAHRIELPPLRSRAEDVPELLEHFCQLLGHAGHMVPVGFTRESLRLLGQYAWPGNVRELRNVVEHCCAAAPESWVQPEHLPKHIRQPRTLLATVSRPAVSVPPLPPASALLSNLSAGERRSEAPAVAGSEELLPLQEVERRHIMRALAVAHGNKARAARLLGVSRHQLYGKLEKLGIG